MYKINKIKDILYSTEKYGLYFIITLDGISLILNTESVCCASETNIANKLHLNTKRCFKPKEKRRSLKEQPF